MKLVKRVALIVVGYIVLSVGGLAVATPRYKPYFWVLATFDTSRLAYDIKRYKSYDYADKDCEAVDGEAGDVCWKKAQASFMASGQ